jgi:copper chaperone CopZ
MSTSYTIKGMTCNGCVGKVQKTLDSESRIRKANIQLEEPQGTIHFNTEIPMDELKQIVASAGSYTIKPIESDEEIEKSEDEGSVLQTYKPLFLIVGFVAGISLLVQFPFDNFSEMTWMRHFMAGFFIVFSFFKILNITGFADTYRMYDLLAEKWYGWGLIYPFVELGLGVSYLIDFAPTATNIITAIILGFSTVGVIKSNLNKRKIKCACLGDVFNLPMSKITIIEDLSMVAMALVMIAVAH